MKSNLTTEIILLCSKTLLAVALVLTFGIANSKAQQPMPCMNHPDASPSALRPPFFVSKERSHAGIIRPALGAPGSLSPLPFQGNPNTGVDRGFIDVGLIYAVRIYSGNFVDSIELAWYMPSQPDNFARCGDAYGATHRIGHEGGNTQDWQYCPQFWVAVGLQGASGGAAADRVGLICGQIGAPANNFTLPIFGGNGGNPFSDVCQSNGFMTGVHVRSGDWMDGIQGLC